MTNAKAIEILREKINEISALEKQEGMKKGEKNDE